ncbi:MAG: hypothetical protein UT66_C0002G0018 [candidate division CPR2 bacterium GW2011_GWC1_39_9]|uniref:Cohesin domain-containing protein n=1 Tax=candidate division CPR2 bacterium GW2011_GWC2_39_10 TaxID=1618345 RepID=A0A0G0PZ54_UNCC2|nr:MAG: hypothetical protein UT18_C0009G0077 [candidate division CPR2 bacterium GW2011_GWC2_39_10]KKR36140.1 MAG: hypothetical protein UT66_C0002G0018 [candidate division CPR2 bacterium GW2011_GWC1_39_9]
MKNKKIIFYLIICVINALFLLPGKASAAKIVYLTSANNTVETGKAIKYELRINTDAEKINAVQVKINFPTEILEGLQPEQSGSFCNRWIESSSTTLACGVTGTQGFSGDGLIAKLVFKGKNPGEASITLNDIWVTFNGTVLNNYGQGSAQLTVFGEGQTPTPTRQPIITPTPIPSSAITPPPVSGNTSGVTDNSGGQSFSGSEPKVQGQGGTTPEEPLAKQTPADVEITVSQNPSTATSGILVKDFFSDNKKALFGFFPTLLLLALVVHLAIKLYFTEKRRKMELEKLYEEQLGALSALESKLDLLDQKGEQGREAFEQGFKDAKSQILNQANPTLQGGTGPAQ